MSQIRWSPVDVSKWVAIRQRRPVSPIRCSGIQNRSAAPGSTIPLRAAPSCGWLARR